MHILDRSLFILHWLIIFIHFSFFYALEATNYYLYFLYLLVLHRGVFLMDPYTGCCCIMWALGVFHRSIMAIPGVSFFSLQSKVLSPHLIYLVKGTKSWVYNLDCAGGGALFFYHISRPTRGHSSNV